VRWHEEGNRVKPRLAIYRESGYRGKMKTQHHVTMGINTLGTGWQGGPIDSLAAMDPRATGQRSAADAVMSL
jgi:hypothetical protein